MKLKTHTGYPETHIDADTFKWRSAILAGDGTVLDKMTGRADSYDGARDDAAAWVESVADGYLKPVEKELETITADDVGTIDLGGA